MATNLILVCGVSFRFVAFILKDEGRREVSERTVDSTKVVQPLVLRRLGYFKPSFPEPQLQSEHSLLSSFPQLIANPQYQRLWRPGRSPAGYPGHPSRFQKPPSISRTRSLSGMARGMCRTVMRLTSAKDRASCPAYLGLLPLALALLRQHHYEAYVTCHRMQGLEGPCTVGVVTRLKKVAIPTAD